MPVKQLFLVIGVCFASVLLLLMVATSAYIALSFKWLLVLVLGWGIARLLYYFRDRRK